MSSYSTKNYFQPFASNTICDITGFKVKSTQVREQWNGTFVIDEAWSQRQPQDFPPVIMPTVVYPNTRFEQVMPDEAVTAPEII